MPEYFITLGEGKKKSKQQQKPNTNKTTKLTTILYVSITGKKKQNI